MNINKKLDRMKQWAGERMGGETKIDVSDDFRALEVEMGLRHEGQSERPSLVWRTIADNQQGWKRCRNR